MKKKLASNPAKTTEIKLETLQTLSFELIDKSVTLWRTYKETDQGKGQKIANASKIHQMVIDAMRFHPDIKHLRELDEYREEAERLLANARKVHPLSEQSQGSSEPTPTQNNTGH